MYIVTFFYFTLGCANKARFLSIMLNIKDYGDKEKKRRDSRNG